jgi:hypothetical protein
VDAKISYWLSPIFLLYIFHENLHNVILAKLCLHFVTEYFTESSEGRWFCQPSPEIWGRFGEKLQVRYCANKYFCYMYVTGETVCRRHIRLTVICNIGTL